MRLIDERAPGEQRRSLVEATIFTTLFAWFSPAFPTGGFAYSHGLETAVAERRIEDESGLGDWLEDILCHGSGWSDAVVLAMAHRADEAARFLEICELAAALPPSRERWLETMRQGDAFVTAVRAGWPWAVPGTLPTTIAYPAAAGAIGAVVAAPVETLLIAFLTNLSGNLIGAGVRLSLCGQSGGLRILARLGPTIADVAKRANGATELDLGGCAMMSDIVSMRHETQPIRVFLT